MFLHSIRISRLVQDDKINKQRMALQKFPMDLDKLDRKPSDEKMLKKSSKKIALKRST